MQSIRGTRGTRGTILVLFRSGERNGTGNIRVCSCSSHLVPVPKGNSKASVPLLCSPRWPTPTKNSPGAVLHPSAPGRAAADWPGQPQLLYLFDTSARVSLDACAAYKCRVFPSRNAITSPYST
jgi:hypothetical protein